MKKIIDNICTNNNMQQGSSPEYKNNLNKPAKTRPLQPEEINYHSYKIDMQLYTIDALNEKQKLVYNHVVKNPKDIVLLEAAPGTGKSYTLLSIAYNAKLPVNVIIYKHDLLRPFSNCARLYTVASFFIRTFSLNGLPEFIKFEKQLCKDSLTEIEFVSAVCNLIKRAKLPPVDNSIVFIDEYTVVPKILMTVLLTLLKHHGIGAVICGDKDQLQSIRNSRHVGSLSSYSIAKIFADASYSLSKSERCENLRYNTFIQYLKQFSCKNPLDNFAYALVTAMFYKQLLSDSLYTHIHLAMHHRELSRTAHLFVIKSGYGEQRKIPVSFYYKITPSKGIQELLSVSTYVKNIKTDPTNPGKFLPYVPLVIGAPYYVKTISEHSIGILESIQIDQLQLTLRMNATHEFLTVPMGTKHFKVIPDEHRQFLTARDINVLSGKEDNAIPTEPCRLLNYPIYPANFITFYRCQGCTLTDKLDIDLREANYQAMYVGLSRVRSPQQIIRVTIKDQLSHLVSCVINFPELVDNCASDSLPVERICDRLNEGRYKHYKVTGASHIRDMLANNVGSFFIDAIGPAERYLIREQIIQLCEGRFNKTTLVRPVPVEHNDRETVALSFVLKNKEMFVKLATCFNCSLDRNLWLNLYFNMEPTVFKLNTTKGNYENNLLHRVCELEKMAPPIKTSNDLRDYLDTIKVLVHVSNDTEENSYITHLENEIFGYTLPSEFTCNLYNLLPEFPTQSWLLSYLHK